MRLWPAGMLIEVRRLCNEHTVLMVADEVMTGFGRTGTMFACEHEGVKPDLMAVAKGLTGGYMPLAATLTTQEVFDAFLGDFTEFRTFFHGHSYTGNHLACAAALAKNRKAELVTADAIRVLERRLLRPACARAGEDVDDVADTDAGLTANGLVCAD